MPGPRTLRHPATLVVVVALSAAAVAAGSIYRALESNPAGYCRTQGRSIGDQEFVRAAVAIREWEAARHGVNYLEGKVVAERNDPRDNGGHRAWGLMRTRADCCAVYRGGTMTMVNRLLQEQVVEVALYAKPNRPGDSFLPFSFDVCGKLLPHEWGYHLPATNLEGVTLTTTNYREVLEAMK